MTIFVNTAWAADDVMVKDLISAEYLTFTSTFEHNDLVILFQPNCNSCKAQSSQLSCIKKIKFLGTNGTEQRLREEYVRFKSTARAYAVELKSLKKISRDLQIVTPQFFKVQKNEKGLLKMKNLGFGLKKCAQIQDLMAEK